MLDVLCGLLLFGAGFFIGRRRAVTASPFELTDEQKEMEKEYQKQIEMVRNFNGRRTKTNG